MALLSNRIVDKWNSLSENSVNCNTVNTFKNASQRDGRSDGQTDGQTDRVRRNMRPPRSRTEGRISYGHLGRTNLFTLLCVRVAYTANRTGSEVGEKYGCQCARHFTETFCRKKSRFYTFYLLIFINENMYDHHMAVISK